jgi:arylsulfatase A-like enzyme
MRGRWLSFAVPLCAVVFVFATSVYGKGKAEHVVLVVWDGLRPDFVSNETTPHLADLRRAGVFFAKNHPVYPSSTNVNGAAIATGDQPQHTGIIGNEEFHAAVDAHKPFDTSEFPGQKQTDSASSARYMSAPTIAEILHKAGIWTAIAGAKPVAQLFDRVRDRESDARKTSSLIYRGKMFPESVAARTVEVLGPFPPRHGFPNDAQDRWTTRALSEVLWKEEVPKFSLLWLSEPDLSQHECAPGSTIALAALKSSDDNLGRVIAVLKEKNCLTNTDIFVVSDHGFSTIGLAVDVAARLRAAGFDAVRTFADNPPKAQVLVVTLGGSVEFYVADHDAVTISRLVEFLQHSDFAGVIFTREPRAGTFTFAQAMIETADAPDLLVACRWNSQPNEFKVRGEIASDIGHTAGQGSHATLSPFDMHNTLLACGPDFRRGWRDETPSGNIDVAPTILFLLGIQSPNEMDGRVLSEALRGGKPAPVAKTRKISAEHDGWQQTLRLTTIGHATYFDQGNGRQLARKP